MESRRLAPLVGILGAVGVLAALAYPYMLGEGGVSTYYGSGLINPLVAGLFAVVSAIALAAGRQDRTEPEIAAAAALVFGLAIVVIGLAWGLTVRVDAVLISPAHRWMVALAGVVVGLAGGWYARAIGVL